ncbi:MAG: hypothetical protein ACFB03_03215 [Paracoccaceae bacterium]
MRTPRLFEAMGGFREDPTLIVPLLKSKDLKSATILRGLRWSAFMQKVRAVDWLDHSYNLYRDVPGVIVDDLRREVQLDLTPLEEAPYEWWRDFCCRPCRPDTPVRVRAEARNRVIVLGTILRATSVAEAYLWGMQPPANDNRPPKTE